MQGKVTPDIEQLKFILNKIIVFNKFQSSLLALNKNRINQRFANEL